MPQNFTDNLQGFTESPQALIEQTFSEIHQQKMGDLPFINPNLQVRALGFELFEGDWLGVLLTPWTLSLLLLPGPGREWKPQSVGTKVGLSLPSGDYNFTYGRHENLGLYLASSIQSPVQDLPDQESALKLARDIRRLVTAITTTELPDKSRRALFTGRVSQAETM